VAIVAAATTRELARAEPTAELRETLADMSVGLSIAKAAAAPKLFQVVRSQGEATVVKLLVAILAAFVHSVKVKTKPDAADILEMADTLAQTYTHESLKDLILALKQARTNGTKFYQDLDSSTVYRVIAEYFERKAAWLEDGHLDQKAQGVGQEAATVKLLGEAAPRMLEAVAARIPVDHPNAEALRRRLSIATQRHERGLISDEQFDQTKAEHRQMATRQDRKDWKTKAA
jgi:hypothetical protein